MSERRRTLFRIFTSGMILVALGLLALALWLPDVPPLFSAQPTISQPNGQTGLAALPAVDPTAPIASPTPALPTLVPAATSILVTATVTPTTTPAPPPPTFTPTPGPTYHTVGLGEHLQSIASRYGVMPDAIMQANNLIDPNIVWVGQTLLIPGYQPPPPPPPPSPTPTPGPPSPVPTTTPTLSPTPVGTLPPLATPTLPPSAQPLPPVWPYAPLRESTSLPIPPNLISVVLLGAEGTTDGWRTDSIQLVMLNPDTLRAGIISFPRDAWVAIPGYGYNRLNTVDFLGSRAGGAQEGPALLQRTLWENFSVPMHFYVRIYFDGFIEMVDALGGVDVNVDCPISDIFPHPTIPSEVVYLDLLPGTNHLDGTLALLYARSRLSTNDFDRARRQQSVMRGLIQRAQSGDLIPRIPELYERSQATIQTNLPLPDLLALAHYGMAVAPEDIETLVIDQRLMRDWVTPEGGMVLVPDEASLQARLQAFFTRLAQPASGQTLPPLRVVVENGTPYDNWAEVAQSRTLWAGGEVVATERLPVANSQTRILNYSGIQTETLLALANAMGIPPERIEAADPATPRAAGEDVRLVIGYDFQLCRR